MHFPVTDPVDKSIHTKKYMHNVYSEQVNTQFYKQLEGGESMLTQVRNAERKGQK